jgi:type VI protein secretion system component VasF
MPVSLLQHCEPVFQAVCRLNRIGRKSSGAGFTLQYAQVRAEIAGLLAQLSTSIRTDVVLSEQYRKVELPLIFFVDSIISKSALPFAAEWDNHRLAHERKEMAGDDKFFDLLDETLLDTREGADERLAVFYTCLGLGFTGGNEGLPDILRKKMAEISPRVKAFVEGDESGLITPATYRYTNTTNLPMPMSASLVPLLIVLAGLLFVVVAVNIYTFHSASAELNRSLDAIIAHDPAKGVQP